MNRSLHCVIYILIGVAAFACREVTPYVGPTGSVQGYQLNGRLTTSNGQPIDSAAVLLYFETALIDTVQLDTTQILVPDPPRPVMVDVFTASGTFVRHLYLRTPLHSGVFKPLTWDERDDNGNPVPGGKYLIRYFVDTAIVKIIPHLVQGHITAYTDGDGNFTIGSGNLPINTLLDIYDASGDFVEVDQVLATVDLIFSRGGVRSQDYPVALQANTITHGAFFLQ